MAEAAKVIENAEDINIAFMNELSIIFNMMGIDKVRLGSSRDQMELLEVLPWSCRRTLHWRGSLLLNI